MEAWGSLVTSPRVELKGGVSRVLVDSAGIISGTGVCVVVL